jgi:hypothetical protein
MAQYGTLRATIASAAVTIGCLFMVQWTDDMSKEKDRGN